MTPRRAAALALVAGPFAYWAAGRPRRAIGVGAVVGLAMLAWAYVPYYAIYTQVDGMGSSIDEVINTSLTAALAWLRVWDRWVPGVLACWAVGCAATAIDMARWPTADDNAKI